LSTLWRGCRVGPGGLIMSHSSHVWSLLEAHRIEEEERHGYAARKAEFRRLSGAALH
jgi:hypothetical protein